MQGGQGLRKGQPQISRLWDPGWGRGCRRKKELQVCQKEPPSQTARPLREARQAVLFPALQAWHSRKSDSPASWEFTLSPIFLTVKGLSSCLLIFLSPR